MKKTGIVMAVAMVLLMLGATTSVGAYHITGAWKDPVANTVASGTTHWPDPGTFGDECEAGGFQNNGKDENTGHDTGVICNDFWWAGNTINQATPTGEVTFGDAYDAAAGGLPPPDDQCATSPTFGPGGLDICDEILIQERIVFGLVICDRNPGTLGTFFNDTANGLGILPAAAGWGGRCFSSEENQTVEKKKPLDYDQWVEMKVFVDATASCAAGVTEPAYFARLGSNAHGLEVQRDNSFYYRQMVAVLVDGGHVTYFIDSDDIGDTPTVCYGYDTHEKCPAPGSACSEPVKREVFDAAGDFDVKQSRGCNRLVGHEAFVSESYDYGDNQRGYDNPDTDANQSLDDQNITDQNTVCTGPEKEKAEDPFNITKDANVKTFKTAAIPAGFQDPPPAVKWHIEVNDDSNPVTLRFYDTDVAPKVQKGTDLTFSGGSTVSGFVPDDADQYELECPAGTTWCSGTLTFVK